MRLKFTAMIPVAVRFWNGLGEISAVDKRRIRKKMKKHYKKFRDYHLEKLRDPLEAKAYLEMALEDLHKDGDREGFLLALRDVTEAQGGVSRLLEKTKMKPTGVYKALSERGNPTLSTLDQILGGLGLRLSIEPAELVDAK